MTACPGCKSNCNLKPDNLYICTKCGAEEKHNPVSKGTMWMIGGKVIQALQAETDQFHDAKERNPTGDWSKHEKKYD